MKRKITITIDAELLTIAESHARRRGVSLSALVESSLRRITSQAQTSFSSRWRGRLKPSEIDEPRYEELASKYL